MWRPYRCPYHRQASTCSPVGSENADERNGPTWPAAGCAEAPVEVWEITWVAIRTRRILVVALREKCSIGRRIVERGRLRVLEKSACILWSAVLHEGRVRFSRTSLVVQVDSGVRRQITLPCLALAFASMSSCSTMIFPQLSRLCTQRCGRRRVSSAYERMRMGCALAMAHARGQGIPCAIGRWSASRQ